MPSNTSKWIYSNFLFVITLYALLAASFHRSLYTLVSFWLESPEFGHGILLAAISAYLLWLRKGLINNSTPCLHPAGLAILAASLLLYCASVMGDVLILQYYTFVLALASVPYSAGGLRLLKVFAFPLFLLLFSIPFHPSINNLLTQGLQLISSDIGVWFIRLMGMTALQDGNVIDMGNFVMLVEEACSGLRYLLPLASLSLLAAYYYKGNLLIKGVIFLSVVPITVIMNSLRIAVTGLIIKYYGSAAAEGFLHDFEGFVVFLAACSLLLAILALLSIGLRGSLSLERNFRFESPGTPSKPPKFNNNILLSSLILIILTGGITANILSYTKTEVIPEREAFNQFPLSVDGRALYPDVLADKFLEILKPDDYFIGDFLSPDNKSINLYMAYYESQQEGSLIHSPKACIPAGGWEISSLNSIDLAPVNLSGKANRAIIEKGDDRLLVYFWVNQQGDNFADESASYFSLIKRSTLYSRTDATLVRVIIPIEKNNEDAAERELIQFINALNIVFPRFLPL